MIHVGLITGMLPKNSSLSELNKDIEQERTTHNRLDFNSLHDLINSL
jgi:hypothetical protein